VERKVIVIAGPTCSGKTSLSLLLAEKLNSEIISADSRQFYKYLNIGTAKPDPEILQKTKHHFIDILEPDEYFNASMFEKQALIVIENLFNNNKVPIVVGGSGLYLKALTEGIFNDAADRNLELREKFLKIREEKGNVGLYEELKKADPESAEGMLPQNWKRVMRALEVFYTTGKSIHKFHVEQNRNSNIDFKIFGLNWEREILYKNIETRVNQMVEDGLINETKYILNQGYSQSLNALNIVGYKEIIACLEGEISMDKAVELIKRNTRHYAKRQMTWFRKVNGIRWFDISYLNDLFVISDEIINSLGSYESKN
jgi:tRNA dimethylallyltransferase